MYASSVVGAVVVMTMVTVTQARGPVRRMVAVMRMVSFLEGGLVGQLPLQVRNCDDWQGRC